MENSSFSSGIKNAKKYFWRVFFISLLTQLAVAVIIALISTPIVFLFMTKTYVLGTFLALVGIVIIIPLLILAFFLENYGIIYAVLSELSLSDSIENAYNLFRKNIGSSILMALIFLPIILAVGLAAVLVFFFLAVIFLVIGLILFFIIGKIGAFIILVLAAVIFLILFLGARSIFETFYQSAWILFFHDIASPKVEEKVEETVPEIKPASTPDPAEC